MNRRWTETDVWTNTEFLGTKRTGKSIWLTVQSLGWVQILSRAYRLWHKLLERRGMNFIFLAICFLTSVFGIQRFPKVVVLIGRNNILLLRNLLLRNYMACLILLSSLATSGLNYFIKPSPLCNSWHVCHKGS